ncbi:TPA: hypothetical protein RM482_001192 [Bacillus cereus]|nr:hypothetical protein [Bacillus cereus]HDW8008935.1 hypothetical protein [Bacillus cereus]HDW8014036.1 hypothetical protein [Bacillus cereus]HDW8020539.1 hypothetical protein [Bacillus cereus]HDW8025453.1 hypothetical protein [Bacillus cereus]
MEDTTSLAILAILIACGSFLFYITYEPIKQWAWSDVKQSKKTHGSGSFSKKQVVISIPRKVGK